jgi:RNA polymerase sigma factor (sigma-70 family)
LIKRSARKADNKDVATPASAPARLAGNAVLACQSDERLVELVRAGHERAFDVLVDRYRRPLIRFCGRILPESRSEDAVQQAFINAHQAMIRSDEPVEVKPWLYTIARNASLNMLRQNGWNYDEIPLDFDGVRRPDQVVEQRIELQDTVDAVNDLPERQRTAIVMREFEGRSYAEIAAALGGGDGAVRQLLNRARVTLRTAVTALTPPPLLIRLASSTPGDGSGGGRAVEVLGGLGAAGLAKAGATALVAGSLVVGAVKAPLETNKPAKSKEQSSFARGSEVQVAGAGAGANVIQISDKGGATGLKRSAAAKPGSRTKAGNGQLGSGQRGPVPSGDGKHSGTRSPADDTPEHDSSGKSKPDDSHPSSPALDDTSKPDDSSPDAVESSPVSEHVPVADEPKTDKSGKRESPEPPDPPEPVEPVEPVEPPH